MFAAVLVVCSLSSTSCTLMGTEPIYPSEISCREAAATFVSNHTEQFKRAFGPFGLNVWCREVQGRPA